MVNVPNMISGLRLVCVPLLLLLAWNGESRSFLALFAFGLATDVADGVLARRLGQVTDVGARLDQWGDFALWAVLPLGAWWLWPETIAREAAYIVLAVACMVLPTAVAYAKYGVVPGYHTWSVKLGAILMGIGAASLLVFDLAWIFRAAALFQIVCAVDELGITYLSPQCRNDVPSVFHAARMNRLP
jgi:CDP-diacylglycerol--glycerol-3-phosphate 3-phosphatidyltransferase